MIKRWLLVLALLVVAAPAWAQNPQCPTRPIGDSTNACASTAFVQSAITTSSVGTAIKQSVRVATTANITLSGAQTIDGVSVVAGDRVLVKDQSTGSQNGIYVASSGAWARATDANTTGQLVQGTIVYVNSGNINGGSELVITTTGTITIGSTSIAWSLSVPTRNTSFLTFTIGGANPFVYPSQWGGAVITTQVSAAGIFNTNACSTCTAIQQISAWASQSGTEYTYALFGQVQTNGTNSGVPATAGRSWAAQLVAYANRGGYTAGLEVDFGIGDTDGTGNPLTGFAYGVAINVAGVSGANLVRGLQFSSIDPVNAKFSDAVVFLQYGAGSIYSTTGSLIKTEGNPTPAYGIDFRDATFGTQAFASTGYTVSPAGYVTSGRYNITSGAAAGAGSIVSNASVGMLFTANAAPSIYLFAFQNSVGTGVGGWDTSSNWIPNTANTQKLGTVSSYWSQIFVAGTSGGIPYYSAANTLSSSGALGSGLIMQGGGAGGAPTTFTMGGDCTFATPNITCTKSNGTNFGTAAFQNTGTSGANLPFLNGTNTWSGSQTITTTAAFGTVLDIVSTEASATFGPVVKIRHTRTSPAANDGLGWLGFNGNNSSNADFQYGVLSAVISDPTAASEDGIFRFAVAVAGTTTTQIELSNGMTIGAPTGSFKGTGTLNIATGLYANNNAGLSVTKTIRASGGLADCTLIYNMGILTGGSC